MPDGPENDYFATQFATSIVKESGGGRSTYWFGRMLRFLGSNEYVFRGFFGPDLTETQFRQKYENGDITFSKFDITNVVYSADPNAPNDPTLAVVTMTVDIEAVVDGKEVGGSYTLKHRLKQGWQAYESELA
jgi:hypothetical protein